MTMPENLQNFQEKWIFLFNVLESVVIFVMPGTTALPHLLASCLASL